MTYTIEWIPNNIFRKYYIQPYNGWTFLIAFLQFINRIGQQHRMRLAVATAKTTAERIPFVFRLCPFKGWNRRMKT